MSDATRRNLNFKLNGRAVTADIAVHETLVEMLQRVFGLFGARESCAQGLCGCCSAMVNGVAVSGCLYLAAFVDEADVITVEGLAAGGELSEVQKAFVSCGALQCGFCTPGFVIMTEELLRRHPSPDENKIRHYLSGNLCRCGSYPEILEAVKSASANKISQVCGGSNEVSGHPASSSQSLR